MQPDERDGVVDVARVSEVPGEHADRLAHREHGVELALLEHEPDAFPPRTGGACRVDAQHRHLARGAGAVALEDLHGGGLAGAVRAEEAEDLALLHIEVDALDRIVLPVPLAQTADGDDRFRHWRGMLPTDRTPEPWTSCRRATARRFRSSVCREGWTVALDGCDGARWRCARVALFSALASPAAAGGSQWSFDREFYLPGDLVAAAAPVAWVHNAQLGTPRDGPYTAWIARNDDMSPFDASVKDARYVGDLRVEEGCGDISGARFCPNIAACRVRVAGCRTRPLRAVPL